MKPFYSLACVAILLIAFHQSNAQGCVAVRNIVGGTNGFLNEAKSWQFSANYRYFHSYKHFVGSDHQEHREEQNTNVINNDHSIIFGANYTLNNKWSFGLSVPFIYINRTSLYEHYGNTIGNPRFSTSSNGIGDTRLVANYLLVDKSKTKIQVGLGGKLPTGNYRYKDNFHRRGSQGQDSLTLRYVDQSIQPGDGGWGVLASVDAAFIINNSLSVYVNGMYLANPRNTNGVLRSASLTNDASGNPIPLSNEFSVADQYFARAGARYRVSGIEFSLGGRIECITTHDLIGGDNGFRRPGFIASVDPAIFYSRGNHIFGINVPVALWRERTRNSIDIARGMDNNPNSERYLKPIHGDAAFADFLVSFSYAFKLNKKVKSQFGTGSEIVK